MAWEIIDTGKRSAQENMRLDREFLDALSPQQRPILHFYDWEGDCATYGHFVDPFQYLSQEIVQKRHLSLARRPTGGGIIFHFCDFAFSALVPASHPYFSLNTLENYAFINNKVIRAISNFIHKESQFTLLAAEPEPLDFYCKHFCMAKPTKYDVMLEGRKVGGAAQRRTKGGFLHQGTISLALPEEEFLRSILRSETKIIEAMSQNSYSLLSPGYTIKELSDARKELRRLLSDEF